MNPNPRTATFLFTDLENSTRLWEQFPEAMRLALARHDALMAQAVETQRGRIVKTTGDGLHAVFDSASDGAAAALAAQQALHIETWPEVAGPLKVRMGLHTGECQERDGDFYGTEVNRAARVMGIAHGGQILVSEVTAALIRNALPINASLTNLGEHRLKGLSAPEQIFQLAHPDLPASFPPLNASAAIKDNLPTQLTSFIGREKEIAEIKTALAASRLVTLTGSGGTGKTRLSIEVGTQELDHFADGVWLIELAPLSDEVQIIPALAQIFGLKESPFAPLTALVTDYLRAKKLLLILDNCEHLIEACARLADGLLHQCPWLKILASSREALGIGGEVAYRTPSLAETESTRLFVERARAASSNFSLNDSNTTAVAQICARLDGIPLAIELAAARAKLLTPEQIATRLNDRFRLLVGGSRTALPRQQTLRALIDWSYDLLSAEEQQLLRTASVFAGGWKLEALEAVAANPNTLEHLEQLINKSLVVTEERASEMRYFMLETIRQYAREKLYEAKESALARDRHFDYFRALSEKLWDAFRLQNLSILYSQARDDMENFRAALEWGQENHIEENVRLAANFCGVSNMMGLDAEGLALSIDAVARAKALPPVSGEANLYRQKLLARALFMQGFMGMGVGDLPLVVEALQEAIALCRLTGDKVILGYSLAMYYVATAFTPRPDREAAAQEAYQIFSQEVADDFGLGIAQMNMARIATDKGDDREKEMYFGLVNERIRKRPTSFQAGMLFLGVGMDEKFRGHYAEAKKHFESGLVIFKGVNHQSFQLALRSELGHMNRYLGQLAEAQGIYRETIKDWQGWGNRGAVANQLECFAFLALADEDPQQAIKLLGSAEALREQADSPMTRFERGEYDRSVAQLRAMLPEAEFNALWNEGRALTMEQAVELALERPHA